MLRRAKRNREDEEGGDKKRIATHESALDEFDADIRERRNRLRAITEKVQQLEMALDWLGIEYPGSGRNPGAQKPTDWQATLPSRSANAMGSGPGQQVVTWKETLTVVGNTTTVTSSTTTIGVRAPVAPLPGLSAPKPPAGAPTGPKNTGTRKAPGSRSTRRRSRANH